MKGVMKFVAIVALACVSPAWAVDSDGDGVDDAIDVCDNTPSGTVVDAEGRPVGDLDQDCDTDLGDFSLFLTAFTDGDVDLDDFAVFAEQITGPLAPAGVVIETVPVGNPGNDGELSGEGADGYGPDRICGAVDYEYNIGKYEVTAGQYTEFLNAVADDDTYGLYNASMWSSSYGCKIERTGSSGSWSYSVAGNWADRPVNYVSWGDAARFANWLHNGQPMGAQDLTTTEDGSYYLNGATSNDELMAIVREPDATWVIPSEDEWYKAAYYDGASSVYYDYSTSSDSAPGYVNNSGNLSGTGTPFAEGGTDPGNYATYDGDYGIQGIGSPYYRTEVGEWENSDSPYGTSDQGGNIWEWNEAILYGSYRGLRAGSFSYVDYLHAAGRYPNDPTDEGSNIGFRVVEVA